ncbi:hypothetical protein C8R44DRAFT_843635 [Mycena epipterygia]|nr:hypothetical protein C8R44DRAFT_843635 [Mycena epipterygia]
MHRRFSSLVKSPQPSAVSPFEDDVDAESKTSTIVKDEPLPPASTKIKRVDYFFSRWSKAWKYKNMNSKVTVERLPILGGEGDDPWKDYCFVVVRTIPQHDNQQPTFQIIIKSEYLVKACQDVIQTWPGISWNAEPLAVEPEIFLTWVDKFIEYRDTLVARKDRSKQEKNILTSVNLLLEFLSTDYSTTLATVERLTAHGEITFDLLYAILVPRTLVVARCAVTGLERIFELQSFTHTSIDCVPAYQLTLEAVDLVDRPLTQSLTVGRVQIFACIPYFKGVGRIDTLDVFPLKFHNAEAQLRETITRRGQKWVDLIGVQHMQYNGIAATKETGKLVRHNVESRIMIDRATFTRMNPNYAFPAPVPPKDENDAGSFWGQPDPRGYLPSVPANGGMPSRPRKARGTARQPHHMAQMAPPMMASPMAPPMAPRQGWGAGMMMMPGQEDTLVHSQMNATTENADLSSEDLLLTPTVVYGFSLSDKLWLEFDVTKVAPVTWNPAAFANLALPAERKELLRSLVEAHHEDTGFDDFIQGKGEGLVVNLFGPPGVGKTFSAEATSEHVQRPLFIIGGGDLGVCAADLDAILKWWFDVAAVWKAIVLIDEADVFLERRSPHDLERNAMVAVFLRHVEYYRGILFLTTNRVQAFDEAFFSRIHVALHFTELSEASRAQVWRAFIARPGAQAVALSDAEIAMLARRNVNGRQIKNAVRTAHSIALGRKEPLGLRHFVETLDAMDEFTQQFEGMKGTEKEAA